MIQDRVSLPDQRSLFVAVAPLEDDVVGVWIFHRRGAFNPERDAEMFAVIEPCDGLLAFR